MAQYRGVRAAGAGIEIRYQVRGRRISRYIHSPPTEAGLQDAARLRRRLIEEAKLGVSADPEQSITFERACQSYLRDLARERKPSTVHTYARRLSVHWSGLAHLDLAAITLATLKAQDRGRHWQSQKTRRDAHSALCCVLQWGIAEGYIRENLGRALKVGAWKRPEIDPFADEEIAAIFAHLAETPRALYGLMLESGCRTGELQALRWSDVETDAITVRGTMWHGKVQTTKTHHTRRVLLTAEGRRILKEHTATKFAGGFVFLSKDGAPYEVDCALTKAFRRACSKAGVRYRRPYYLRHTYASRALSAGVSPAWLAEQMGDRVETVLRHYARWIGNVEKGAAELAKIEARGKSGGDVGNAREKPA